jgi:hypothetical protein
VEVDGDDEESKASLTTNIVVPEDAESRLMFRRLELRVRWMLANLSAEELGFTGEYGGGELRHHRHSLFHLEKAAKLMDELQANASNAEVFYFIISFI